jgi:hypothetical protein
MQYGMMLAVMCLALILPACHRHDPTVDISEVRRLTIGQDSPGMDTSTIQVVLVHPDVAVASNLRIVVQPTGDTLRLPQMWVYVFEKGRWQVRISS